MVPNIGHITDPHLMAYLFQGRCGPKLSGLAHLRCRVGVASVVYAELFNNSTVLELDLYYCTVYIACTPLSLLIIIARNSTYYSIEFA